MGSKWRLFHSLKRQQTVDLSKSEILKLTQPLSEAGKKYLHVWKEGYADWVPFLNCLELLEEVDLSKERSTYRDNVIFLKPKATPPAERRRFQRATLSLKAIVVSESKTFITLTQNISLGGVLLAKNVPWEKAHESCTVFITAPGGAETLSLQGKFIASQNGFFRITFIETSELKLKKLSNWLGEPENVALAA